MTRIIIWPLFHCARSVSYFAVKMRFFRRCAFILIRKRTTDYPVESFGSEEDGAVGQKLEESGLAGIGKRD